MLKLKIVGIMAALALVISIGSALSNPVFAAQTEKASVCHYQELVLDPETQEVVEEAGWSIINISGNLTQSELADRMLMEKAPMGALLDKLEIPLENFGDSTGRLELLPL